MIQLPEDVLKKALKLFSLIDIDGSKTIDKEETLKFWSSSFARLNSNELFSQVDKNNDGTIQLEEWIEFWTSVYNSGYSQKEICDELDNLLNRGSWVKFQTVNENYSKRNSLKLQGKI